MHNRVTLRGRVEVALRYKLNSKSLKAPTCTGGQLGNFERYNYNRKDEIIHCLSPSVKCVSNIFGDLSLDKV